jgi:uncharacterized membrane protein YtjA (UPF0391 family)
MTERVGGGEVKHLPRRIAGENANQAKEIQPMGLLTWTVIFLVLAIIAAGLGFTGVAKGAAVIAQVLFAIFLIIFIVLLLMALTAGQAVTP